MRKLFAFCLIACCVVGLSLGCGKTETKPDAPVAPAGAGETEAAPTSDAATPDATAEPAAP